MTEHYSSQVPWFMVLDSTACSKEFLPMMKKLDLAEYRLTVSFIGEGPSEISKFGLFTINIQKQRFKPLCSVGVSFRRRHLAPNVGLDGTERVQQLLIRRTNPVFFTHIRAHSSLPGPLSQGNANIDALLYPLQSATQEHCLHHTNSKGLQKTYSLTRKQAQRIVRSCSICTRFILPFAPPGVNPRGLQSNQIWQMDVVFISSFVRLLQQNSILAIQKRRQKALNIPRIWVPLRLVKLQNERPNHAPVSGTVNAEDFHLCDKRGRSTDMGTVEETDSRS
ncbi:uncharacterized protein [Ovis canadensis]|uniref:uncharacterized protein n=1 Tax=Ovis canadensis TaxID=37174 RepID=UPI003750524C